MFSVNVSLCNFIWQNREYYAKWSLHSTPLFNGVLKNKQGCKTEWP